MKKVDFTEYLEKAKNLEPNADEKVLKFIYDFIGLQRTSESAKVIYTQFESGYCYYFAVMLRTAFNRGTICWHHNCGHVVWKDDNNVAYDIGGVFYDYDDINTDLLPVDESLGELLIDFKHNGEEIKIRNTEFVDWAEHYDMTPVYAIINIYRMFASKQEINYNRPVIDISLDYWGSHKNELGLYYAEKKYNNPEYKEMLSMDMF